MGKLFFQNLPRSPHQKKRRATLLCLKANAPYEKHSLKGRQKTEVFGSNDVNSPAKNHGIISILFHLLCYMKFTNGDFFPSWTPAPKHLMRVEGPPFFHRKYLEPVCPLFWALNPPKKQVDIYEIYSRQIAIQLLIPESFFGPLGINSQVPKHPKVLTILWITWIKLPGKKSKKQKSKVLREKNV